MTITKGRHLPGCGVQALTDEMNQLSEKADLTPAEIIEYWQVQAKLTNTKLLGNSCQECGVNQITGEKNRDRRVTFAK